MLVAEPGAERRAKQNVLLLLLLLYFGRSDLKLSCNSSRRLLQALSCLRASSATTLTGDVELYVVCKPLALCTATYLAYR